MWPRSRSASRRPPRRPRSTRAILRGNNGFIKVEDENIDDIPQNDPHVGCVFDVEFYNFDQGPYTATVTFEAQAPTTGPVVVTGNPKPFIGEDAAGGGKDLDTRESYALAFTGAPHSRQGFHVKLTIHAEGSIGADVKHKVFWVDGCGSTPTPTSTPTETPTGTPTETPTGAPSETPSTAPTQTSSATSAVPSPPAGVPTEVEAGLAGPVGSVAQADSNQGSPGVGAGLLTVGGIMIGMGSFLAMRRRGLHRA